MRPPRSVHGSGGRSASTRRRSNTGPTSTYRSGLDESDKWGVGLPHARLASSIMTRTTRDLSHWIPLLLLGLGCGACSGGGAAGRPNIVLITLDTTRPDYFGTYGYAKPDHTPHFDALAEDGARFDMAISASSVTPVSHASILTGTYPYTHGLRVLSAASGFRIPEGQPLLSSFLKEAGYATGAVHSAFPVSSYFGFNRDFDLFDSMEGSMIPKEDKGVLGWDTQNLQRRSDGSTDVALAWVAEQDGPFFLWIHYWDPHDPTLMPPDSELGPRLLALLKSAKESGTLDSVTRDRFYAAEIHYLDAQFGRLIQGFKDLGVYDNSVIALTADHGEGLSDGAADHNWAAHRMVYQEQILVPLIIRTPTAATRSEIGEVVRTVDIVPTLLDYAGLDVPDFIDGESLRPLIEGRPSAPRIAYADQINGYDTNASMIEKRPDAKYLFCIIDGDWKLTYRPHMLKASELYNLRTDPDELVNRINDHPEIWERLMADLAKRDPWVLEHFADDGTADPDVIAQLEALGYAEGGSERTPDEWQWTCPGHYDERFSEPGTHAGCGKQLVPVSGE
ncbi:MAG: arylsulfatase [Chlamydiales bacterium]|jgi:arylsulfatase